MSTIISKTIDARTIAQARRRDSGIDLRIAQRWEAPDGNVREAQVFFSIEAAPRLIAVLQEALAYAAREKAVDPPPAQDAPCAAIGGDDAL